MTCCTYGCTGGHGCAAHTEPVNCTGLHTHNGGATIEDGENHPWSDLSRFESTAIWIIVWLCTGLVSYLAFLAWQFI